jgi:hypothetical protein
MVNNAKEDESATEDEFAARISLAVSDSNTLMLARILGWMSLASRFQGQITKMPPKGPEILAFSYLPLYGLWTALRRSRILGRPCQSSSEGEGLKQAHRGV